MTALAANKNVPHLGDEAVVQLLKLKQKGSTTIYQGALVVINAGYAAPATTATGLIAVGRGEKYSANAGADGAVLCEVRRGIFAFENSTAGDAIAQADVGKACYIVDDQTVAKTDGGSTRSLAGRIISINEGDSKVYVEVGLFNP